MTRWISIHSLLAEGDHVSSVRLTSHFRFQSTPSSRRETRRLRDGHRGDRISIHSLLAEGDRVAHPGGALYVDFNPLPPRGGRRVCTNQLNSDLLFQSTPSSRRETAAGGYRLPYADRFQSTPSSRRETQRAALLRGPLFISIHSLLAEGDHGGHQPRR